MPVYLWISRKRADMAYKLYCKLYQEEALPVYLLLVELPLGS